MSGKDQLLGQIKQQLSHFLAVAEVQKCGGFIAHNEVRVRGQNSGQCKELLLPAGKLMHRGLFLAGEPEIMQDFFRSTSALRARHSTFSQGKRHVFNCGGHHQLRLRIGEYKTDRKSTRLNSSHVATSYAVFCLKKRNDKETQLKRYSTR